MNKRSFLRAVGACAATGLAGHPFAGHAQAAGSYPSRPITLVAPYGAGNTADVLARFVAQQLGNLLGQPVVVENRPGAGGVGAINQVAAAAPDGHSLLLIGASAPISQSLFKPAPYDMLKSFVPVATLSATDVLVLVNHTSKLQKLEDFIRAAREKKGAMMVGVSLLGTTQHLSAELFRLSSKLNFTVVPYKTASAVSVALLAGEIDAAFELVTPALGVLQAQRVRTLAICSAKRSELLPAVPTVAEVLGTPSFDTTAWGMVVAPAHTPDAIVQRLNRDIQRVLGQPELLQRLKASGQRVLGGSAAQAQTLLTSEVTRWAQVIAEAKVSLQ